MRSKFVELRTANASHTEAQALLDEVKARPSNQSKSVGGRKTKQRSWATPRGTAMLSLMAAPIHEWIAKMRAAHERADREEYARVRAMSQEQRVAALQAACLTAQRVLEAMTPEARQRALGHRDPLPESSIRALERLRELARQHAQR